MGWKASCIFLSWGEPGYLGSIPEHEPARARQLIQELALGDVRSSQRIFLIGAPLSLPGLTGARSDMALYPPSHSFELGVYEKGVIFADQQVFDCVKQPEKPILQKFLSKYPGSSVMVLELHSVVDYCAFALYEQGRRVRAFCGDPEHGVQIDDGALQPEEKQLFKDADVAPGMRSYACSAAQSPGTNDQAVDELELAFALSARFFGMTLDQFDQELRLERFVRRSPLQFFTGWLPWCREKPPQHHW
jgi:hypothetical protein